MNRSAAAKILSAGILWGSMGLFVRTLTGAGLNTMDIVFVRTLLSGVSLFVYLAAFHREALKIRLRDIWCFLGTGIASITFFNFCYFRAITLTSMAVAAVLLYTAPVFVMVLSCLLFGEKFTGGKLAALAMTVVGCGLVTGLGQGGLNVTPTGFLLGLGAGLGYGLYSIFSRFALDRGYSGLTVTCYTFLIAAAASWALADPGVTAVAFGSIPSALLTLSFGFLCTILPYLLYTSGLSRVENTQASILASIEPVTAAVLGIVLYGEAMTPSVLLGIVLVLGGMVLSGR